MKPDEIFEQWKQKRRDVSVKDDFADRVMERADALNSRDAMHPGWRRETGCVAGAAIKLSEPSPKPSSKSPHLLAAAAVILIAIGSAAIHLAIVLFFTFTGFNLGT